MGVCGELLRGGKYFNKILYHSSKWIVESPEISACFSDAVICERKVKQREVHMSSKNNWQMDLSEYIRQGEPSQKEKSEAWMTAIGLQDVDGLQTSPYLLDTAKNHIEGKISIDEAEQRLFSYYEEREERNQVEEKTREADIVSSRITKLLGERSFNFSSVEWIGIHRRLFEGIFKEAGKIRDYNISKREWVLKGESVVYSSYTNIRETMEYDFSTEKGFSYGGLSMENIIRHLSKFTCDIWQIHPFCEGNTRATAVFIIKYLNTLGFQINNDMFERHSWYFRNALVRANYSNLRKGIYATTKYLELFFSNLLLGTNFELKNRYLHLDYVPDEDDTVEGQTAKKEFSNRQNGGLNGGLDDALELTSDEKMILGFIEDNPDVTQKILSERTGKSIRTIQRIISRLKKKNILHRVNGRCHGKWMITRERGQKQ